MKIILIISIVWFLLMALILSLFVNKPLDSETRRLEDEEQARYLAEHKRQKELKKKEKELKRKK